MGRGGGGGGVTRAEGAHVSCQFVQKYMTTTRFSKRSTAGVFGVLTSQLRFPPFCIALMCLFVCH